MLLALDSTVHPEGPKELEEVVDDLNLVEMKIKRKIHKLIR